MRIFLLIMLVLGAPVHADFLVPVRTIRAKEIITADDIALKAADVPGAFADPESVIGQEARAVLYPGRPIRPGDIGPPALISRNDAVTLVYTRGGLHILAEGRALGRGAAGEVIRAMNSASRAMITGRIRPDGSIEVR
ncbi:flagellar basal body P-ring formation protein FlgA [Seohaeicola saemankumensis]|nr:flagellar basal body P-ring formation chaperone FlgA [Seohaeicola saemankumensis]MCA0870515.1 flagellar basal body P-ring formation protein FlgA [Seohaeicola saemankumensis]